MPNLESKPVTTSIRVDHEHTIEMRADMASKTAEVENLTTGEMYTSGGGGGGDSDFEEINATIRAGVVSNEMEFISLSDGILRVGGCDWETAKYVIDFETVNGIATILVIGKNGKAYISSSIGEDYSFVPAEALNQISGLPADFIVSGATFGEYDIEITDGANLVILTIGNV